MQNGSLYDALSVWVGKPTDAVPFGAAIPNNADIDDLLKNDTSRLNLSATISGCPGLDCQGWTGRSSPGGTNYTTGSFGTGAHSTGPQARVVFRIRTNRTNSDQWGSLSNQHGSGLQIRLGLLLQQAQAGAQALEQGSQLGRLAAVDL